MLSSFNGYYKATKTHSGFSSTSIRKGFTRWCGGKSAIFTSQRKLRRTRFFRAYQKLGTLKNHNLFAGWLYVIAARLCADWFQKSPPPEQSLETTDMSEGESSVILPNTSQKTRQLKPMKRAVRSSRTSSKNSLKANAP